MTGEPELWRAPWLGAAGLMVSPSRGLLVYSPFLGFAFWGMLLAPRDPRREVLRPVAGATLGLMLLQFCWHDWWGGSAYGYRPLLDTLPGLSVCCYLVRPVGTSQAADPPRPPGLSRHKSCSNQTVRFFDQGLRQR